MRYGTLIATAFLVVTAASSASAQQVGEYTGFMADGSTSVTIDVAKDPNNGKFEVTTIGFGVVDTCEKTKETLNYVGIGLNDGADVDSKGRFSYASTDFYEIDLVTKMTFKGTKTVSGKGTAYLSAFNPAYGHDKLTTKTQACTSPDQSYTARFSGPATPHALPPGTMTVHALNGAAGKHSVN